MGKALYRKYRSKTLDDVVGQEHITNTLKNALEKDAISHAYLFTGPRGVGKTSVARILAHEINKLPYDEEVTHLDIIEIDAASNRRIDEIRDLREKVHIAPTSAKYKVYIIDEVHMLTREAFNALLKTLEEPPEHVVFILATTEAHKVPETIISRTQQYSFKPISPDSAISHLRMIADKESLIISDEALRLIASHGRGSFRDSISMLDQLSGLSGEPIDEIKVSELLGIPSINLLNDLILAVSNCDGEMLFSTTRNLREKGSSPQNIAQNLIDLLKNEIINNNTTLSKEKTIELMKNLLISTGAQSSLEQIEILLLNAMTFNKELVSIKTTEAKREEIDSKTTNNNTETIKSPDNKLAISDQNNNEWNKVLETLKTKHNTLYGILRMAEVEIIDEKITLTFTFEFHKKQLNQSKNLDALQAVIVDKLGKKHDIEILVIKQQSNTNNEKTEDKNIISSVSNIFGGAELLES